MKNTYRLLKNVFFTILTIAIFILLGFLYEGSYNVINTILNNFQIKSHYVTNIFFVLAIILHILSEKVQTNQMHSILIKIRNIVIIVLIIFVFIMSYSNDIDTSDGHWRR